STPLTEKDTFANYSISGKGLNIINVRRYGNRYWAYFKAFFLGIRTILSVDFVYLFYPGPICAVLATLCILFRKDYGIYVRGEQGITSRISSFLYSRAKVVFTISPKFTELIRGVQKNASTIRPMVDINDDDFYWSREYP